MVGMRFFPPSFAIVRRVIFGGYSRSWDVRYLEPVRKYSELVIYHIFWARSSPNIVVFPCFLNQFFPLAQNRQAILFCITEPLICCNFLTFRECAPSTSLHVTLSGEQSSFRAGWKRSGFECRDCDSHHVTTFPYRSSSCADCSLCSVGNYTSETGCVECPAGINE